MVVFLLLCADCVSEVISRHLLTPSQEQSCPAATKAAASKRMVCQDSVQSILVVFKGSQQLGGRSSASSTEPGSSLRMLLWEAVLYKGNVMLHSNDSCSSCRNGITGFQWNQGAALALGDCTDCLNVKKIQVKYNCNSV